jgi:hypothetical protein
MDKYMDNETKDLLHEGIVVAAALAVWEVGGYIGRKVATYQNKRFIKKVLYSGDQNLEDSYNKYAATLEMPECLMCTKSHLDKYSVQRIYYIYCAVKKFQKDVLKKK